MKKYYHIIISLLTVGFCAWYVFSHRQQLDVLKTTHLSDFVVLMALMFLFFCATGYTFNLLLRLINIKLTVFETIGLSIATNFGNYLGPISPGVMLKAVYLKSVKGLAYSKYTTVFAVNNVLGILMAGVLGVGVFCPLRSYYPDAPILLLWISIALTIGTSLPFVVRLPQFAKKGLIAELIRSAIDGFKSMRSQKGKLLFVCFTYIAQFFLWSLMYKVVFASMNVNLSYIICFTIAVFIAMSDYFRITPNNLGIQEVVSAFLITISGHDFTVGVIGAGLIRLAHVLTVFILAPFCMYFLFKVKKLKIERFW